MLSTSISRIDSRWPVVQHQKQQGRQRDSQKLWGRIPPGSTCFVMLGVDIQWTPTVLGIACWRTHLSYPLGSDMLESVQILMRHNICDKKTFCYPRGSV